MERRLISAPTTSTADAVRREDATELSRARCRMAMLELSSSLRRSRALATRLLRSWRCSSSAAGTVAEEATAEVAAELAAVIVELDAALIKLKLTPSGGRSNPARRGYDRHAPCGLWKPWPSCL